jgi:Mrp family chromosome partitioning ATPase
MEAEETKSKELNQIKHIVAVMSGKGGVGKSLVTALVAIAMNRRSMKVGIFDADITGPTIPHLFGIHKRPETDENKIFPVKSSSGISIMSMNLLLPHEDDLVSWRGPIISGTIKEFWEHVVWGDLDLLLVDLPPGTSDEPLTVLKELPVTGTLIVSTPQALVGTIVRKAINLSKKMKKPVLGIVENMSYLVLTEVNKNIELFGESKVNKLAAIAGASFSERIPLDPQLVKLSDSGKIEDYHSDFIQSLGNNLIETLKF